MTTSGRYRPLIGCGSVASTAISRQYRSTVIVGFVPIILLLLIFVAAAPGIVDAAGGSGVCDGGCQNGGKLLMPNNLLGYCRCRCPPDYKGPKCQFIDKRSVYSPSAVVSEAGGLESLLRAVDSLSRRNRLSSNVRSAKSTAAYEEDKPRDVRFQIIRREIPE